jgi:hypothetical protein
VLAVGIIINVVPRLVALSAAPAAKHCSGLTPPPSSGPSENEIAIGRPIPVTDTVAESVRF